MRRCPICHYEIFSGEAYCHHCDNWIDRYEGVEFSNIYDNNVEEMAEDFFDDDNNEEAVEDFFGDSDNKKKIEIFLNNYRKATEVFLDNEDYYCEHDKYDEYDEDY
jgi:hypothetical protein